MNKDVFFEEIFESLIEESKKFVIEYDHRMTYYKEDEFIDYLIQGVNGYTSSWSFKNHIKELCKDGLDKLKKIIENEAYEDRQSLLEYILEEFSQFRY